MEQKKKDRISFLAKKKKEEGLTEEEAAEQQALYAEYLAEFRLSFQSTLERTSLPAP